MSQLSKGYHPLQVSLHWLIAFLVFAAFIVGKVSNRLPNDDAKLLPLALHMTLGILTLIAMIVRFVARIKFPAPAPVSTGKAALDWIGKAVHYALYLLVFLMAVSGMTLSLQAGLTPIVFGRSGSPLPADFLVFTARAFHGLVAPALLILIVLHMGAAFYHQFALKDNLMARMGYSRKEN
ncbi:MAG: cytochrome b [Anaerolineales bacterium]|nr:cytochrome b [Anaerolineales bacterium]